jgi:hypothetical protein
MGILDFLFKGNKQPKPKIERGSRYDKPKIGVVSRKPGFGMMPVKPKPFVSYASSASIADKKARKAKRRNATRMRKGLPVRQYRINRK